MGIVENLLNQNVSKKLIDEALYFKQYYKLDKNLNHRISNTNNCFYGKEIWEMSIASILEGENILLSGPKALWWFQWAPWPWPQRSFARCGRKTAPHRR